MDLELAGKKAIVTGGSRGIGKVIASVLAAEGVDVVISARGEEQLHTTARELANATGRRVVPIVADTGNEAAVNRLVQSAIQQLGGVDILVNNAALPGGSVGSGFSRVARERSINGDAIPIGGGSLGSIYY